MAERTEEQKLAQTPLVVTLGGEDYNIAPLVIKDARAWRQKVVDVLALTPDNLEDTNSPDSWKNALQYLMVTMQDTVLDLFFAYARELKREEIERKATEEDIEIAFNRVVEVGFPLARSLPKVKDRLFR